MTMFPTKTPKLATVAQFRKIREYYEQFIPKDIVRSIIRSYEINGQTTEHAATEIRRLQELQEKALPTVPEGYEKK